MLGLKVGCKYEASVPQSGGTCPCRQVPQVWRHVPHVRRHVPKSGVKFLPGQEVRPPSLEARPPGPLGPGGHRAWADLSRTSRRWSPSSLAHGESPIYRSRPGIPAHGAKGLWPGCQSPVGPGLGSVLTGAPVGPWKLLSASWLGTTIPWVHF